jgi:putative FmdB family regulatory protein
MPIYEFYCHKCNTVYNFFARSANTDKIPYCPQCKRIRLKRQMSIFAKVSRGKDEEGVGDDMPPFDEAKMEKAMAMLAGEADKINEDDPRQAANLMRKLSEATGLNLGSGMEEALRRMEQGEDPEREDSFAFQQKGKKGIRKPRPRVNETLYDL